MIRKAISMVISTRTAIFCRLFRFTSSSSHSHVPRKEDRKPLNCSRSVRDELNVNPSQTFARKFLIVRFQKLPSILQTLSIFVIFFCLFAVSGCGGCPERLSYAAPTVLPRTERFMKSPGFWIAQNPYPDKQIMDAEEITIFNKKIESDLKVAGDLSRVGSVFSGRELAKYFSNDIYEFVKKDLFLGAKIKVGSGFYALMRQRIGLDSFPEKIKARYGFVTHLTDQRLLPTENILSEKKGDIDFDELQNSSLDVATPLLILYETKDGVWVYADSPSSSGWLKKENVVFCSRGEFKDYILGPSFAVVITPKADIFLDKQMLRYYDYARMGVKIPIKNYVFEQGVVEIAIPAYDRNGYFLALSAYVKKEDVNIGFLPYTPRRVIEQAFKMLNAPYGWGGINGEQDCSAFLQEVFAVFGITLPRNSSAQAKVGREIAAFTKKSPISSKINALAKDAVGGITLLRLDGHIMFYLGKHDNRFYGIHETYGYGEKMFGATQTRVLNRVVVSDLLLGEGSKKGSLLERLLDVRRVEN